MKSWIKIQLFRVEKYVCMLLGVQGYLKLRSLLRLDADCFDEVRLVANLMLPECSDGLMIDVGAHHGESFRLFAFSGWRVIAFEPDPSEEKHEMIRARSTKQVSCLRKAVSDTSGQKVPFYVSTVSTGVSSLTPFLESHTAVEDFVLTETLSDCLSEHVPGRQVDFLKIDTEGHDLFVLKGLDWNCPTQCPRVIVCEFEDRKTVPLGYNLTDAVNFLQDHGYRVWISEWYPITAYGVSHRWRSLRQFPTQLHDPNGWGNLIAVRGDDLIGRATEHWRVFESATDAVVQR